MAPPPSILEQLLGSIATPSRSVPPGGGQRNAVPCVPPAQPPALSVASLAPPPPPQVPAPVYQAPTEQFAVFENTGPSMIEPAFSSASYREKLRAGGRGALQRSNDAGFMTKVMKQDWNTVQIPPSPANGFMPQHEEVQNPAAMQYAMMGDSQHMWSSAEQMQSMDCWGAPVDPSQMQCSYAQASQLQQQMMHQSDLSQMTAMPDQQWGGPMPLQEALPYQMMSQMQDPLVTSMQTLPMTADEHSLQMLQMTQLQLPQMQLPQMEFPPTPMSQVSTTASDNRTPRDIDIDQCMANVMPQASPYPRDIDIDQCMAIVLPQASPYACDRDLIAAQLRAAAECQCYED